MQSEKAHLMCRLLWAGNLTVVWSGYIIVCTVLCKEELSWIKVTTQMFNVPHFRRTGHLPFGYSLCSICLYLVARKFPAHFIGWVALTSTHRTGQYCFWEQVLTQRGPFPARSCLHNVCRVSCQSVIVVKSLIVSAEVATPRQKTLTVWLRRLHVMARIEINCLACKIQTGEFHWGSSAADILTKEESDTIWRTQSGKHPLRRDIRAKLMSFNNK